MFVNPELMIGDKSPKTQALTIEIEVRIKDLEYLKAYGYRFYDSYEADVKTEIKELILQITNAEGKIPQHIWPIFSRLFTLKDFL